MVPGISQISASRAEEASRTVPVQPSLPPIVQGLKAPGTDAGDKFQPVRVGPLFEVATSNQDDTVAKSDQRVEEKAYAERVANDRNADDRSLQEKLYRQY